MRSPVSSWGADDCGAHACASDAFATSCAGPTARTASTACSASPMARAQQRLLCAHVDGQDTERSSQTNFTCASFDGLFLNENRISSLCGQMGAVASAASSEQALYCYRCQQTKYAPVPALKKCNIFACTRRGCPAPPAHRPPTCAPPAPATSSRCVPVPPLQPPQPSYLLPRASAG